MDATIGWTDTSERRGVTDAPRARSTDATAFAGRVRRHGPREIIFVEGQQASVIYELLEGTVVVDRGAMDGRRQIVDVVRAGDVFGVAATENWRCRARTVRQCLVRAVDREANREDPRFADWSLRAAFAEIDRLQRLALALGQASARERLVDFLVSLAVDRGDETLEIELPITRAEIANHLGMTVETMSRCLTRLKREGVIEAERGNILMLRRCFDPATTILPFAAHSGRCT